MKGKKVAVGALVAIALALPPAMRDVSAADAPIKVARIGYLEVVKPGGPPMLIVQELGKLGYIEGKNLVMEYRSANGIRATSRCANRQDPRGHTPW